MHFKSEMGIFSGYIYFLSIYFYQEHIYTLIIQTYELDVRRGEGRGNTDVRDRRASGSGEGSQKLTKSQYFGSS